MDLESIKTLINDSTLIGSESHGKYFIYRKEGPLFAKDIWVCNNIATVPWLNFYVGLEVKKPKSYFMQMTILDQQAFKFGVIGSCPYTKEISGEVSSRIQVIGNGGFSCVSEWLICNPRASKEEPVSYCFEPFSAQIVSIPTGTIPSFTLNLKSLELELQDVLVLILEFAATSKLKWTSPATKLSHAALTWNKLYCDKKLADVELNVTIIGNPGSSETIMAHKAVLATRSRVFDAALTTNMVEMQFSRIDIVDFEPQIIRELLKYLYTGEVDLDKYAVQLLKCSDKYDIPDLMDLCQNYIGDANIISQYKWKVLFGLIKTYEGRVPILEKGVGDYFKKNETTLKQSAEFEAASEMYPEVFVKLYFDK